MGNYSGTTRCGYCGESGHNKAGCPKLKERVEYLRDNDPSHYLVREWDRKAEGRVKRATGKRVCAYCKCHRTTIDEWAWRNMDENDDRRVGMIEAEATDRWGDKVKTGVEVDTLYGTGEERGVGHSVRACKYRKRDIELRTAEIAARRVSHLERMLTSGIGPGATVVFAEDTGAHREYPVPGTFAITSVAWASLGTESDNSQLISREVLTATHVTQLFNPRPEWGKVKNVTLPADTLGLSDEERAGVYRSSYTDRVASLHTTASEDKIRASIPFGWADATDDKTQEQIMDQLMNDVKTRAKK